MGRWTPYPPYPSGLRLAGRRVVMVGGGHVAQRRVPALLCAGAVVWVVSPEVTPSIEALADAGEITWERRPFADHDLDETWYVVAATDDKAANEAVSAAAEARRIFCVRADDATAASAWTPAVGRSSGVTVAVLGKGPRPPPLRRGPRRDPRGTARGHHRRAPPPRQDPRRGAGRWRARRPGADDGGRPQGADGGRRGRRRPARPARPARRAAQHDRADRRRQDPPRPVTRRRRPSTGSSSSGRSPASGWCGSRAVTASSSAAGSRRCWRAARPA